MKIKMKNYARHLWLSLLLLVGVAAIAVPGLNETNESSVAKIGNTEYATLESAFAAAPNGETVTLLTDVTLSGNLELALEGKSVTFDLGGNTLNGRTNLKSGSLTIQNGKIVATGETQALNVYGSDNPAAENYSVLTIASSVIVDAEKFGVCLFGKTATTAGYGAVVNIAGEVKTVGTGKEGTVFVSGNLGQNIAGDMKNVINITGKVTSTNDAGVALNGNATVNVKRGAEITGNTGIAVKRGVLNVEDGATVHATGAKNLNPDPNNNGTEMTGAAISMTDTYNNYGAMSVNITGGTFKSDNTVALFKEEGTYTNAATYSVSGGTFSSAVPAEFCAEGYKVVENNGTWTVKESYVAQIGTVKYETLESAFAAAQEGNTITLLTNVTLSGNLELALEGKNVTLDLGGKTLNGRTNLKSGNLTVKNGTVNCEGGQPLNVYGSATEGAQNYSVLTIAEDVNVAGAYGVCMFGPTASAKAGYGAVANIAGTLNGTDGTVFVSGNLGNNIDGDMNNVINITGKINGNNDAGVALNGNATVNVKSGAEITGNTGIAIKRGVLNVEEGATVHATGAENLNPDPNNNGTEMTGAAISMTDTYNNYGALSVNITGGTFTSDNTIALFKKEANYTNDATYSVSGGTFSTAVPAEFCAPGYEPKDLGNGQYSVYAPAYSVTVNKVDPKTDWYMGMTTSAIQFSITKDGSVLSTKDQYTEQLDKWDIILDENYLQLKSKVAAAKWIRCNLTPVGTGTTTVVFQNKANPSIKVEQEVTITHKLILVVQPSGTHMVEAGPVEIGGNTKFDGVKIEDYNQFTFTSSDETIATISGTKITPLKSGTITVTVTKNDDPSATASANITFIDAPAKIGETYYESIGKALKAAKSGETITLLRDVTESTSFSGEQPRVSDFALTIDLNGHTWTGASQPYTLKMEYGVITIKDSQGGGGVKYGNDYAFIVSHLAAEYPSKLILESGTFTGKTSVAQVGYPGGTGSNKKYYGGDLVINGGTFVTVPDAGETYDENGNFKYTLNMLDMAESSYPGGIYSPSTITVNGGKFLKFDPQNNLAEGANTNFVPEGLVSTKSVESGEAWYTISKIVAKIGETTYTSLADAFEAAQAGQTITVLTDIDLPSTINVTKQVTLDLNGNTISNTSDLWVGGNWSFFSVQAGGNLTVTGNGTIDAKENDCYSFDVRDGGILTIKNGTFTGNISCVYLINEAETGVSTCNIEGGTFSIKQLDGTSGYNFLLNCRDASYKNNTAKFNVTGGSFVKFNPANNQAEGTETNFCAPGYEAVQNGDVWTVQKAAVAQIEGGAKYETLQAAINACEAGTETTIKLLDNVTDGAGFAIPDGVTNKNIIIDFDGKSYNVTKDAVGSGNTKSQAMHFYSGNTLTLKNGTITSAATSEENKLKMMMQNYCDLTLDGMTIDCSNVNGGTYPDYSGTTYEYWSNKSVPVFNFNTGNATIKNTTITFRDGDNMGLCVDGGTVALGEGTVVNGPVSAVTGIVTITGGKYSGAVTSDQATLKISGGIFAEKPADEYCAEGYVVVDNEDEETSGTYPYAVKTKEDAGVFELLDWEPYPYKGDIADRNATSITYKRKFTNTSYNAWFVPFDYIITEEDLENFDFYKFHMISASSSSGNADVNNVSAAYIHLQKIVGTGTKLRGNSPYVIVPKKAGEYSFTMEGENLKLLKPNNNSAFQMMSADFDYDFYGTYDKYGANAPKEWFGLNKKGELSPNSTANATMQQYRWVLKLTPRGDNSDYSKINIGFIEDDDATGLSAISSDEDDQIEGIYSVNGSKHDNLVRGINIIRYKNGTTKKVIVK